MKHILALLAVGLLLAACATGSHIPADEQLYLGIKEIDFQSPLDTIAQLTQPDKEVCQVAQSELCGVLAFKPNAAFMGSSSMRWPLQPRLWLYEKYATATSRFGTWMQKMAEEPIYVSTANPDLRCQVARNTLYKFGFFSATASYELLPTKLVNARRIAYHIASGPLYHLGRIVYTDFSTPMDSLLESARKKSLLATGQPFNAATLASERERLNALFRNNGYYHFTPQYFHIKADTTEREQEVQLYIQPSPNLPAEAHTQYYIGNTHIDILRNSQRSATDTLRILDMTVGFDDKKGVPPLRPGAIRRFLFYKRGDRFNSNLFQVGEQLIVEQGLFSQYEISYIPRDSIGKIDTLDVYVRVVLDKPYDAEFEGKVTSKSNGQVGPGVSFSMTKQNAFRNGEVLGLKGWASYEWQTGADLKGRNSLMNSFEYGVALDLTYPRILLGKLGKRISRQSKSSTQFVVDAKWMNRSRFFSRVSFGAHINYSYQPRRNVKHTFTPFSLTYDMEISSSDEFVQLVSENSALLMSMENVFKPAMKYGYNWTSTRHAPRSLSITLEESGNLTSLIYRIAGKRFNEKDKHLFGVPFAQFVKASAQYTHQFQLTPRSCIATRAFAGIVYAYGNGDNTPYADLFHVGGANSLRAFAVRSIGPGAYQPGDDKYSYISHVGDMKLEMNAEYRFPIVGNLHGALFVDAGNVWNISTENVSDQKFTLANLGKQIALGTGAGLRYDLGIFVLRFDVGVGIHAPYDTGRSGYYNMPSFKKSLGYHFSVGYPF